MNDSSIHLGRPGLGLQLPNLASQIAMAGANFHMAGVLSMIRGVEAKTEDVRRVVERGVIGPGISSSTLSAQGGWT